ncbi:siderophore-interacting protein [Specibacter cremeus]|uniref:siderophore-interacting protein n=1 Tax=Specibacter cremeus TaxID=1629051 RepID=UPI000F79D18C|nr:siderophore-interacting protein [Specibacter cremeus]
MSSSPAPTSADHTAPAAKKRPQANLTVLRTERLGPHMVRVVAGGPGLSAFEPKGFTDMYVKIHFVDPAAGLAEPIDLAAVRAELPRDRWPATRTYTIRRFDPAAGELAVDFVVHGDAGLAGPWAANAVPGDTMIITGPGGAYRPDPAADWHLLAGDDSALPAVAAAIESLPATAVGHAYLEVDSDADVQPIQAPAGLELHWVLRRGAPAGTGSALADAVTAGPWLAGRVHVFAHGERESMKALRDVFFKQRGLERSQVSLSGYWAYGRTEDSFQAEKKQPIGKIL